MFEKVLVANRGEIAIRVIRALRELGIASVAVYSEVDRDALHVKGADEAYLLGPGPAAESYLNVDEDPRGHRASAAPRPCTPATASWPRTRRSPRRSRTRASRSSARPRARSRRWAPRPRARELMKAAGVPIVPGTTEPVETVEDATQDRQGRDRLPGRGQGGGRRRRQGLPRRADRGRARGRLRGRRARGREVLLRRDASTSSATCPTRATSRSRSSPTRTATCIHLGERDCSIQRRHQKLIEEAPAPAVDDAELRERIGEIGVEAAQAVDYVGAGTIEGLLPGRRVLLPGDEHPRAGRALRDRDGHRHRHRQGGHPRRRRRAAVDHARTTSSCAATRSSAASTPRTRRRTSRPRPGKIGALPRARGPGRARRLAASARAARSRRCTTRWSPS